MEIRGQLKGEGNLGLQAFLAPSVTIFINKNKNDLRSLSTHRVTVSYRSAPYSVRIKPVVSNLSVFVSRAGAGVSSASPVKIAQRFDPSTGDESEAAQSSVNSRGFVAMLARERASRRQSEAARWRPQTQPSRPSRPPRARKNVDRNMYVELRSDSAPLLRAIDDVERPVRPTAHSPGPFPSPKQAAFAPTDRGKLPPGEGKFKLCPRRRMPREGRCGASPGQSRAPRAPAEETRVMSSNEVFQLLRAQDHHRRLPCLRLTPLPAIPRRPPSTKKGNGRLDAAGPTLPPRRARARRGVAAYLGPGRAWRRAVRAVNSVSQRLLSN